ncbi:hypothetical protein IT407_01715 [Candidatus Uhrbacteria bacterium]|nr:hypothetical protein [Candidatus Uhrbacteria bacterium]
MKKNLFVLLAVILLWPALNAQAQGTEIVLDRDALSACQAALVDLRARVAERGEETGMCEATEEDLEAARRACMVQEGMSLGNAQALWRLLNPTSTRVFSSQDEIAAAIRDCRPVIANRCDPEPPPEEAETPDRPRTRTPRTPRHHIQRFCVYGAEAVWNSAHTRIVDCVCDPETHMEVRVFGGEHGLAGDPAVGDARDVYVGCAVWHITGTPRDVPPPSDGIERLIRELIIRIERLEHQTCDRGDNHPGFQDLCDRVTTLERDYRELETRVTELERDYRALLINDRAICVGDTMTDAEWIALSDARRVELCEEFHEAALRDDRGDGGSSNHRFLVSIGVSPAFDFASMTVPVRGDIRAQYEYGFTDDAWLYVRLETGYGTQGDSANWIATVPIAESANWGFGLGAAFDVTDHVILSAGASYHGLLNPGPYAPGELWGDYRGHSVTGDFGLRLEANPRDAAVFFGELDLSVGWSRVYGERNDAAVPLDSAILGGSLRFGIRF